MMSSPLLLAPFPYFGGKSTIAAEVWRRLGDVASYIEPFFGSGAVLLGRPENHLWWERTETVNDLDGMVSNFWRAVQADHDAVARYAEWPVNENDLHARHAWLVCQKQSLAARLEGDPDYYDAKIAGWWCWGMCCWIGGGFCHAKGPWHVVDGELIRNGAKSEGNNIKRERPQLGSGGRGVKRKRLYLGNDGGGIYDWMRRLSERLRRVRVCSGDWSRICTPVAMRLDDLGPVGVFLDPPYSGNAGRDSNLYSEDSPDVALAARAWALEWGQDSRMRIALCGYQGEYDMPSDWTVYAWKTQGGYSNRSKNNQNRERERIWFSPHCLAPKDEMQLALWKATR